MNQLYRLLESLESKIMESGAPTIDDVDKLKVELLRYKNSEEKWLRHLSKMSESLSDTITLKDLMLFMVPIERHLKKKVTDLDLLISTKDKSESFKIHSLKVVLDNVRSAFNTGALIRTCETLGASEVIFTGYTQGLDSDQVIKTSMGARPITKRFRDLEEVRKTYPTYSFVALETSNKSQSIYDSDLEQNTIFIVGNERFGLSEADLQICDKIVCLPTFGRKNSLNVNAALSACGYEWVRRFSE